MGNYNALMDEHGLQGQGQGVEKTIEETGCANSSHSGKWLNISKNIHTDTKRTVVLNQGRFCPSRHIWQCLETFLIA